MLSPRLLKLRKVVLISLACAAGIALILAVTIYAGVHVETQQTP